MQIIFKGDTIECLLDQKSQIIEISYFGNLTKSEDFREAANKSGSFAISNSITLWLLDQHNMNVHPKDLRWFYQEWQPNFDKAMPKSRKVAIIPAKNLFSEFYIKQQNQKLEGIGNFSIKYFSSKEEARKWLLSL